MDFWCALSGIEIAMWDIVGKALGQPVYNLLGGPVRPAIRLYANAWSGRPETLEDWAVAAKRTVDSGFTALKFDPLPGPWRAYPNYDELEQAAAVVGAVREAVGGKVELLIEIHRRLAPMNSVRFAHMIERYRPYWFEEPNPSENIPAIAEVRSKINIPVVTGEALYTREEFREVLDLRAADILNPDICNCGGILELVGIADMAAPHFVAVSPHGNNSVAVGLGAAAQASAVMPNFLIYEYFVHLQDVCNDISVKPLLPEGSYLELPTEPGIGVELDESKFAKYSGRDYPPRQIRTLEDERDWH
jgi:galactonate dehydratase